jgi:hypothetical protein
VFGRRPVLRTVGRTAVIAGTATAVSGRVARRQNQRWAEKEQAQYYEEQQAAAAAPPPAPAVSSDTAELQQLAQLHAQGVLTDEEFAAKKAQILGI